MEIEKTRETSWKIQLKRKNENIELTSVEISGEVRAIKLTLFKDDSSIMTEMNKEEFFNFLSLISAFKEVVIGDESIFSEQDQINVEQQEDIKEPEEYKESLLTENSESSDIFEKKNSDNQLNPEEWDPW
jgi:hypothetical protein